MSALNAALCRCGIILWLAVLLASRSTHSAPVYDQDTTQIAEYDGAAAGCYFNFQRYQEGDRIITSEPCLNCTCHNRMLMCYLKVCPFTKGIGQDCTVEKRPDQCCPVITCPEVPVQLLTSTSAPISSDSTEVGFHDNFGCNVDQRFYMDGAQLPVDHHNPCELCYCIRNKTTCVMQECTLQVAGCKPVYQPGVCCPIKYNCEYDEEPSTTVGSTPGLIVTTTLPPGVLPQCYYKGQVYEDGDLIYSTQPCQHCYCFRGEIACAVQNCGTPMEAHGKNCTAIPPPEGKCCPTTYQCEEDGQTGIIMLPEGEEQFPEQISPDLQMTESPILIDQEQQVKGEHPQKEFFPGADNAIPHEEIEEGEGVQGTIEHITEGHIPSTEKPKEESTMLPVDENAIPKTETTTVEKESIIPHEHITETSPTEKASEEIVTGKLPMEVEIAETEMPTTMRGIEELSSEKAGVEIPESSSISEGLQPEEETTTKHIFEEHVSTEQNIVEQEHSTIASTEKEQPTEPSISEETQTEGMMKLKPEESTSSHEELPAQIPEQTTEIEKIIEGGQVSVTEEPEISTEIIKQVTSPIAESEQSIFTTIPESITELTKEGEDKVYPIETTSVETLATETDSPIEKTTIAHEASSSEQTVTEKEEILHSTEVTVTEEIQSTEVSTPSKEQSEEEQKPVPNEGEEELKPEKSTSEHAIIEEEHATVGAKKEDGGLTENPVMSEEPIIIEEQYTEKSIPEIPLQVSTNIPIPERMPEQKAEDKYHVTEDYHDITHPEIISSDNLVTEPPEKTSTTYFTQDRETTLILSKETEKPIIEESTEQSLEITTKPIPEVTEVNLSTQKESSVTEVTIGSEEISTAQVSTELSITTISHEKPASEEKIEETAQEMPNVPKETEIEIPQMEVQSTEEAITSEEMPTKGLTIEESGESSSEEVSTDQSSEEEKGAQSPIATEPELIPEMPTSIPTEHEYSTMPPGLKEEQVTEGEQITIAISSDEQMTHVPHIETTIEEKEEPTKEHTTKEPSVTLGITDEGEKELQTEEPISKKEQTTETVKEVEEKSTTQMPIVEENKTELPKQYSTEKPLEETTIIEGHDLQKTETPITEEKPEETEDKEGVPTESIEQQTEVIITGKEPEETGEESTETTSIQQTELPIIIVHPTEKVEEESEEKISTSVSTEEVQTEVSIDDIKSTELPAIEKKTEEVQTRPSITDRKEDQESIEPRPIGERQENEGQITQKPSTEEKEITEIYEKSTVPSEATHIPPSKEIITESIVPEEILIEGASTTELISTGEAVTQPAKEEQPEIISMPPEEVVTELSEQEKQTQEPVTEEQPELHVKKEIEMPSLVTHEEPHVTPNAEVPEELTKKEDVIINESTEIGTSEDTTKPILISETSTEAPTLVEEHTDEEGTVPTEKEIVTVSISLEERQQETSTQSSIMEEKPNKIGETESVPVEISTEEAISETSKVPVVEEQPQKPEDQEISKETTVMPIYEHKEYSTIASEEISEVKSTTEVSLKEISSYSTEYPTSVPKEIPIQESTSEIAPRPSGIPGEGNCLVEGQSYSNNSAVPPANVCQISCHCISSIVQCELVQCPAPPAHLSNCMPVPAVGDSCCPMYACDSTSTSILESDSHMIESHTPETEEGQKTVLPSEISTEGPSAEIAETTKESSTIISEITTPESLPTEITIPFVSQPEEEIESTATEKEHTTLKSVEPVYGETTTIGQPIEQHPEEHTVSSITETSKEFTSQIPEEEEHTEPQYISQEITEGKVNEETESITKLPTLTKEPQEEIIEEQTPISGEEQVITSTHIPSKQESHTTEEEVFTSTHKEEEITVSSVTEEKEISIPIEIEQTSISEKEEEVTTRKEEETTPIKEQGKPFEEEDIKEQTTVKLIEEIEKTQPEEEKIQPISEEPILDTAEETSMVLEEGSIMTEEQPARPDMSEEEKKVESVEHISITPEIQPIEHKPEEEVESEEKVVTSTEGKHVVTEELETQTKLPTTSQIEIKETTVSVAETTTLILQDYTTTEELPLNEYTTVKSAETSTKESKEETEQEILTEAPVIKEEHILTSTVKVETPGDATTEQELEKGNEEAVKPIDKSIPEVSHEGISPISVSSTESVGGLETIEHTEEYIELSVTEHEEEPSTTKLPEEKSSEPEFPQISTEQPVKTIETETIEREEEHEKPTESSITHGPESTQITIEGHPEVISEIESHTPKSSAEEHMISDISTTSAPIQEESSEQPITSIMKDISEPNLGEAETEQPIVPETESKAPTIEEKEQVTIPVEEQTSKYEEYPIEEQTIVSHIPNESEISQTGISMEEVTSESITSQEEQVTEKIIESIKPETELPLAEEHTTASEIESGITEQPVTEDKEATTEEEVIKEEVVTHAATTEKHLSIEDHTEQEVITPSEAESGIKVQKPAEESEVTILPKEEGQVISETSLPEHPISEEATTASIAPEEHPTISVKIEEQEGTREPEYQTTLPILEEEVSKPMIEASEVEKLPPEGESVTAENVTEGPQESVTKVPTELSSTEQPEGVLSQTETPVESEQPTESSEEQQEDETITKVTEGAVIEEKLPEETISYIPETEEKATAPPLAVEEEETHSTASIPPVEMTSVHEEEQSSVIKLQPTEGPHPSEEKISAPEETQSSQPEEGEEVHPVVSEEPQPTEHAPETSEESEEHPEIEQTSETISSMPTELPKEKITIGPISSEEPEPEVPVSLEEGPQSTETSVEEHVTQPISTELPAVKVTEEIPEEGEEIIHPHSDHFPESTTRPETDYSAEGDLMLGSDEEHLRPINHTLETTERPYQPEFHERPATTYAPHIPEYPEQSVSDEDNPHFPMQGGTYLNPDEEYDEDDQAIYGPGTCRYGGKVYVSAQQIPRDDPCDFCFCFRSDIICLQQSCPPPIPGCHEEPISGFCCPRYECPVSMATALNLTTTTTTTTTTLPPHFHAHAYKGAARRSGCQISGQAYRVGEVIKSASGPCLHCTCGGDGNMKCDPRVCTPEPMLRQMIAAATAKRRR